MGIKPDDDDESSAASESNVNARLEFVVGRMMTTVLPAMTHSEPTASEVRLSIKVRKLRSMETFQDQNQEESYLMGLKPQASRERSGYKMTEPLFNSFNISFNVLAPSAFKMQMQFRTWFSSVVMGK